MSKKVNSLSYLMIETEVQVKRNLNEMKKNALDIKKTMELLLEKIDNEGEELYSDRGGIVSGVTMLENANSRFLVEKEKMDRLKDIFEEQMGITWEEYKEGSGE